MVVFFTNQGRNSFSKINQELCDFVNITIELSAITFVYKFDFSECLFDSGSAECF